jgi:predicted lipid carrier protein YhbT
LAGFLTDAWLDELDTAARAATVAAELRVVVQQVVPDGPDGHEVTYVVEAADGRLTVRPGRVEHPDVTFTQDRATALAIHRGELSAQAAFMEGRLRLGGDLRAVIGRAGALAALDDVFAAARA